MRKCICGNEEFNKEPYIESIDTVASSVNGYDDCGNSNGGEDIISEVSPYEQRFSVCTKCSLVYRFPRSY